MKITLLTAIKSLSLRWKPRCGYLRYSAVHFCQVVKVSTLGLTRTLWRQQVAPVQQCFLPQDYQLKINSNKLRRKVDSFCVRPINYVLKYLLSVQNCAGILCLVKTKLWKYVMVKQQGCNALCVPKMLDIDNTEYLRGGCRSGNPLYTVVLHCCISL